ncbi:ABC transporter ATP-binding protein [Brevibacillus fluminis]|uniref:Spermidine/putrescine import ATP-binding protein PotA n=1 Tax=Brevibacillus fluminis TaxID=511487 RepID=A0A3M8DRJ4_9BACL|nr:ABC transporter ATP-binding protein [Brevibacillus fluminis]RNB90672.1 ABC transporter ATP-binding protein [Brevibacillus fluminis]
MNEIHLAITDATKWYKKFKAVDKINLEVKKGEFLTILGPSGSGKTSLLKLIAGFEEVSAGSIYLNHQDITGKKPYERDIGMLFQNYALFPHMTIADNIAYPLRLRKVNKQEIRERVQKILDLVHLSEYGNRFPAQLSGGQQQRVALARAIVFNPPLLLLDEPLGALDKNLREKMQLEIKHIQEKIGITTISVTHDQEEALTMSDRVCVMNKGRIEQIATPQQLYQRPVNKFVAEFIGEINLLAGEVVGNEEGQLAIRLFADAGITLHSNHDGGFSEREAYVAIRPENIQLASDRGAFKNTMEAKVCETIYVGDACKVKTRTACGHEMTVKIPARLSGSCKAGDEILLGWNLSESTVIPYEREAILA